MPLESVRPGLKVPIASCRVLTITSADTMIMHVCSDLSLIWSKTRCRALGSTGHNIGTFLLRKKLLSSHRAEADCQWWQRNDYNNRTGLFICRLLARAAYQPVPCFKLFCLSPSSWSFTCPCRHVVVVSMYLTYVCRGCM